MPTAPTWHKELVAELTRATKHSHLGWEEIVAQQTYRLLIGQAVLILRATGDAAQKSYELEITEPGIDQRLDPHRRSPDHVVSDYVHLDGLQPLFEVVALTTATRGDRAASIFQVLDSQLRYACPPR